MNLIERRRQMMMSKSKPYDAEIEYLESSGTQYIDTGIIGESGIKYECDVVFNSNSTAASIVAGARISTNKRFGCGITPTYNGTFILSVVSDNYTTKAAVINTKYNISFDTNSTSASLYVDNVLVKTEGLYVSQNINLWVFGWNYNGSLQWPINGKIYYFKLYDSSNILVRDFIPVRVGQVGYMYDRVSGQLFGNQGTGNFVLGADKA